ncbi:MAG TPA: transcriptional regulator [Methanoregulaceae archaeon]|nr:transcriptional regulator [Methanoregulaceae archaeon]
MLTLIELLEELNLHDEHPRIEAKSARNGVGSSAFETISALSNEPDLGGGYIVFGVVKDVTGSYILEGVDDPDRIQCDLVSQCANPTKLTPIVRPQIRVESIGKKVGIVVFVPEAPGTEKPVYITQEKLPRGAYRRIGSSDVRCTADDLQVLYQSSGYRTFDSTPVTDASIDDLDPDAILEYRRIRQQIHPDAEELTYSNLEMLRSLNCLHTENGTTVPTLAGLVLFGKASSLRRLVPLLRVDYIQVPGTEWIGDTEHPFETMDLRGPLMLLIPRLHARIVSDLPRQVSFREGHLQRRETPKVPERVIREALVNAVMHRSYRERGPIQIIRYANRLEVRNPGYSLVAIDLDHHPQSTTRNEYIAAVLHETHYAENKGSGIHVMLREMRNAHLSDPEFESSRETNMFVARFMFHHLLEGADLAWLAQFGDCSLSEVDVQILHRAREKRLITNADCREATGLDIVKVSNRLRRLRKLELLDQHGGGAQTYYTPSSKLLGRVPASLRIVYSIGGSEPPRESKNELLLSLPEPAQRKVLSLGVRMGQRKGREAVVGLCSLRPFTLGELAELLGKSPSWIKRTYVGPLVENGDITGIDGEGGDSPTAYRATSVGIARYRHALRWAEKWT